MNLLSVPAAAKRLQCSNGHIYNLVAAGKLTRHNIGLKGSKIRIAEEDLERYIAESVQPVGKAS